jgi:two-component system NtrC family sensor kinase
MKYFLLIIIGLFLATNSHAQSILVLDESGKAKLEPFLQILLNSEVIIDSNIINGKSDSNFKVYSADSIADKKGIFWLKFTFSNNNHAQSYFIGTSKFDYITCYFKDSLGKVVQTKSGSLFPFKEKKLVTGPFSFFEIPANSNQQIVCYLKVENITKPSFQFVTLDPMLFNKDQYLFEYGNTWIYNLIFLGICMVMILYNLMLFLVIREKTYFIYVGYILSILSYVYALSGDMISRFFINASSQNDIVMVTGIAALLFYAAFAIQVLDLKKFYPRWNKLFLVVVALQTVAFFLTIFGYSIISIPLCFVLASLTYPSILTLAFIIGFKKNYSPATYFFAAAFFYIIMLQTSFLQMMGVLPVSIFGLQANNFTQIGVTLELVLFSIALASRLNQMRKEKYDAQKEAITVLAENERIIKEQNTFLENKVNERTTELSKTLEDLKSTQNQLVMNEKMASLGQLVAGIAHEINNPINFVSSNIGPLKRDFNDIHTIFVKYKEQDPTTLNPVIAKMIKDLDLEFIFKEIYELIDGIDEGSKRTSEIVRSLRNFSRTDESELKLADINEGIDSTLLILQSKLKSKSIKIERHLEKLPFINCYPGQLNQVFMNIISNASDAIDHSTGIIEVSSKAENNNIYISIKDNGFGMSTETKAKIFDPFYTTKNVGSGTGLGLSITYGIINKHNGSILVDSELGVGSTFTIILPVI